MEFKSKKNGRLVDYDSCDKLGNIFRIDGRWPPDEDFVWNIYHDDHIRRYSFFEKRGTEFVLLAGFACFAYFCWAFQ